ncbi:g-protein beta wd-40 repeats containing [Fusarium oxysporum f. sp. phaseoli]
MPEDDEAIALEEYTVGWLCALPLEMAAAKGIESSSRVSSSACRKSPQRIKDKFGYQGASNDRLYQADYDHVTSENPTCNECDKSHIIHRIDRDDNDSYFHYGIIASGSAAVKDGKTRQRLSEEYGALCFETEAAGLYDFPCLIIHGIYDYADSHMSNLWQEYAAATAAAFAKELLLFVAPGRVW